MITPWIRSFNYIEDFYSTLYEIYAEQYVASYPVTYYSLDMENSVLDKEVLDGGSYEKDGVGALSGALWKKIQMLPVFGVEQVSMNQESGDKGGMTFKEGATTQIVFPSLYGLLPLEGDIVDMSFGYKTQAIKNKMLFVVGNVNPVHQNDTFQIYQCRLKMANFNLENVEKQISSNWMFYEHEKSILPLNNVRRLLSLLDRTETLYQTANDLFDTQCGFYLHKVNPF